ncbi:hypothetical protein C5S29_02790 [ANME-1 cluster archaeon GoMg3.2]|nr:hypothetical protein [ANME-1 cluster archaeon GoMg3.2]
MAKRKTYSVFSSNDFNAHLGNGNQAQYLIRYLNDLGAQTCVLEEEYIDKDYLIDYQKFYSRSFGGNGKFTKRMHFFKEEFSSKDFTISLKKGDTKSLKDAQYLGFVVIRPIKDEKDQPYIGRTLLETYPDKVDGDERHYVISNFNVSLFGITLQVKSLPFQAQDEGVSACATIALWSALQHLGKKFGTPRYAPAEITEIATSLPQVSRLFPSAGLYWGQMINGVRSLGLDIEVIKPKEDNITTAVKAYINAGFPIIAALTLKKNSLTRRHAVVISGYRCDKNENLKELYVHDDRIGPFSKAEPKGSFQNWKNEWNKEEYGGYSVDLEKLLIPIYHKMRLTFSRIYTFYQKTKDKQIDRRPNWDLRLYLFSVQKYKEFLLGESIKGKEKILTKSLPRFLWVIRGYDKSKSKFDAVYDGTSIYPRKKIVHIEFI